MLFTRFVNSCFCLLTLFSCPFAWWTSVHLRLWICVLFVYRCRALAESAWISTQTSPVQTLSWYFNYLAWSLYHFRRHHKPLNTRLSGERLALNVTGPFLFFDGRSSWRSWMSAPLITCRTQPHTEHTHTHGTEPGRVLTALLRVRLQVGGDPVAVPVSLRKQTVPLD